MSDHIPSLLAILFCILMSAYFSATETAFSSINKARLKVWEEEGKQRAKLVLNMAEDFDKVLSTILIGNNVVNIALSSIATLLFVDLLKDADLGAAVSTAVITVVVLIFGEVTPKSIAKDYPERFAMFSAPFLQLLMVLLTPVSFLFSLWRKLVSSMAGKFVKEEPEDSVFTDELTVILDDAEKEGTIDETEGELLRNAIEFRDLNAEDILTHRTDLEAVSLNADKADIARKFTETHFSRLIVYNETIDNIVGVINLKDFYVDCGMTDKSIQEIMTDPVFVHPSEKIRDLLQRLQKAKAQIAVVLDEYGGTLGIVTMEDILEELVGDIWDEHDEVQETFQLLEENTYRVDCMVNLPEFQGFFDVEFESESVSLGGWITEQLGGIPNVGDSFEFENLSVTVTELDAHRVSFAKVIVTPPAEEEE